ncbi:hypothetical protein ACSS6W_000901 [Trichoderma asperelloides]
MPTTSCAVSKESKIFATTTLFPCFCICFFQLPTTNIQKIPPLHRYVLGYSVNSMILTA